MVELAGTVARRLPLEVLVLASRAAGQIDGRAGGLPRPRLQLRLRLRGQRERVHQCLVERRLLSRVPRRPKSRLAKRRTGLGLDPLGLPGVGDPHPSGRLPGGLDRAEEPRRPHRLSTLQRHPRQPGDPTVDDPRGAHRPDRLETLGEAVRRPDIVVLRERHVAQVAERHRDPNRAAGLAMDRERFLEERLRFVRIAGHVATLAKLGKYDPDPAGRAGRSQRRQRVGIVGRRPVDCRPRTTT